jgi:hypothetical protein
MTNFYTFNDILWESTVECTHAKLPWLQQGTVTLRAVKTDHNIPANNYLQTQHKTEPVNNKMSLASFCL